MYYHHHLLLNFKQEVGHPRVQKPIKIPSNQLLSPLPIVFSSLTFFTCSGFFLDRLVLCNDISACKNLFLLLIKNNIFSFCTIWLPYTKQSICHEICEIKYYWQKVFKVSLWTKSHNDHILRWSYSQIIFLYG